MSIISKSPCTDMDKSILYDEYASFMKTIKSYSKETPFYVYSLCYPDGNPFYIGKGIKSRAFFHIKSYINNKLTNNHVKAVFDSLLSINEVPIMFILHGELDEASAYEIEELYISHIGRISNGGSLCNIMSGGAFNRKELDSHAGKIGGRTTKDNNLGIFSSDYDRSSQSKSNWENGLMDHVDFHAIGKIGGAASVLSKKGIHAEGYDYSAANVAQWASLSEDEYARRVEHNIKNAKLGGLKSKELGTNFSSWDVEKQKEVSKLGGAACGKVPMWTNGIINKRSYIQPEIGFFRGITKKHKNTKELITYKFKEIV